MTTIKLMVRVRQDNFRKIGREDQYDCIIKQSEYGLLFEVIDDNGHKQIFSPELIQHFFWEVVPHGYKVVDVSSQRDRAEGK